MWTSLDAARTLGASRGDVFRSVTLPLILPGVVTGTILAFAAPNDRAPTIHQIKSMALSIHRYQFLFTSF